ncbi:MAG: oligosaccharide flippase family protein [bacterium]
MSYHSGIFMVGGLASKLVGFLLIPVYTRYLSPADYGILELLFVTLEVVTILAVLGVDSGLFKAFSFEAGSNEEKREVVSSAYYFILVASALIFGGLILLARPISSLLLKDTGDYSGLLRLLFMAGFLKANSIVPFKILRANLESIKYTLISLLGFVIAVSLNIYFIVGLNQGLAGIVYSDLISSLVVLTVNTIIAKPWLIFHFYWNELARMLRFGLPLVPTAMAYLIINISDRYFLEHLSTTSQLGLYSLGNKFSSIFHFIFLTPFLTVWPSIYFPLAKSEKASEELGQLFTYFWGVGVWLVLWLSFLIKPGIIIMAAPEFHSAYRVVPILLVSLLFYGVVQCVGIGMLIAGKTKYIPGLIMLAAGINLGLNSLLIPSYGMMGAAWATLFSYLVMSGLSWGVSQRIYPITYELRRVLKIGGAGCLLYGGWHLIQGGASTTRLIVSGILLSSMFPFLLYFMGVYHDKEIEIIKEKLKRWRITDYVFRNRKLVTIQPQSH